MKRRTRKAEPGRGTEKSPTSDAHIDAHKFGAAEKHEIDLLLARWAAAAMLAERTVRGTNGSR